jgi:hypothetical protein
MASLLALGAPIPRDDGALADAIAAAGWPFTKTSKTSKTVAMHQPLFIGFRIEAWRCVLTSGSLKPGRNRFLALFQQHHPQRRFFLSQSLDQIVPALLFFSAISLV